MPRPPGGLKGNSGHDSPNWSHDQAHEAMQQAFVAFIVETFSQSSNRTMVPLAQEYLHLIARSHARLQAEYRDQIAETADVQQGRCTSARSIRPCDYAESHMGRISFLVVMCQPRPL